MNDATLLLWLDRGRTLAYALVAIGVVGEFLVDRISGPIIKRRDEAQRGEIARFHAQAEEASATAAAANERAAGLEAKAAQLQLELEKERAARLPRSISDANRARLIACLKNGPRGPMIVVPKTFDEEAEAYAKQITDVLQQAQFEIRLFQGQRPMGFGKSGVFIFVNNLVKWPEHAAHVQRCLSEIGVQLIGVFPAPNEVPDPNVVVIAVSSKP